MYGSYEKLVLDSAVANLAAPTAINYNAAAGNIYETKMPFMEPASVTRFGLHVTTAFSLLGETANMALKLYRCPAGANGSRIELATMDVPAGNIAVNSILICDVDNAYVPATKVAGVITVRARNKADLDAGDTVQIAISTGANGSTETGAFQPFVCFNPRPEPVENQALVIDLTP
jgi:hypothetical protein